MNITLFKRWLLLPRLLPPMRKVKCDVLDPELGSFDRLAGFLLILEPFETENATVPNPVFHLTCLDPSLAIKPVFERFSSVVITSGTISPLDMYPKMLQFTPVVQETYMMTLTRNCFLPLVGRSP
jgi:Rad3-related DNA helicase